MPTNIPYKSFCWSFGTTSFRTKNFNKTIEEQLALLNDFWQLPENVEAEWSGNNKLQIQYYNFMLRRGFVEGKANRKDKDAREKTSGLVDIGLIDGERRLTEVGQALLKISLEKNFTTDNQFQIDKDSFIYLKQLLKTYNEINGDYVRPFVVLLYILSKLEEISFEEFTYLIPLCTNKNNTEEIVKGIKEIRKNTTTIDNIILSRLMSMDNYQAALKLFINNLVDDNLICEIGLNRKSRTYDKNYFELYQLLYSVYVNNQIEYLPEVFEYLNKINIARYWKQYLFKTNSKQAIRKNPQKYLNTTLFDNVINEIDFKNAFFRVLHLLKAKATLKDYSDLNRRYIKTSDIILFEDSNVKLDVIPKYFFKSVISELYLQAFIPSKQLLRNCALEDIASCLVFDENTIIQGVNNEFGIDVNNIELAREAWNDNRYQRFQHLIDTKFNNDNLLILLDCFEQRNDKEIQKMVTDNADVPTIFEYILGIVWYKASERQGNILDYMKLTLDADLLPKTHAAGGEADIVYEYNKTNYYPQHTLLLEATLTDSANQRRMEMEPVSRHLGRHLICTGNLDSYCVFVTNYLDINVIADFRTRKHTPFYDPQDYNKFVDGMKIIPLQTSDLKKILKDGRKYKELYILFDEAFKSNLPPHQWYDSCIRLY